MATTAEDPERMNRTFQSIESMLDEAPQLAEDWAELSIDERTSWSLEWDNEMAKLRHVAEAEAAGLLNRSQARRFRALAEWAVRLLGVIEQINLQRPDEIVLTAGRVAASS